MRLTNHALLAVEELDARYLPRIDQLVLTGCLTSACRKFPFFLFGILGVSGAIGDFKTMRAGVLRGAPRLSRHLWRMCMALFITAASFFSIRARVAAILPAPLTTPALRALPVVLVLVTMFYWLWRVRFRRSFAERWPGSAISQIRTMPAASSAPAR
jgi:hypothetical protein